MPRDISQVQVMIEVRPTPGTTVYEHGLSFVDFGVDCAQGLGDFFGAGRHEVRAAEVVEAEAGALAGGALKVGGVLGNEAAVERACALRFRPQRDDALDACRRQRLQRLVVKGRLLAARQPPGLKPAEVSDAAERPDLDHVHVLPF